MERVREGRRGGTGANGPVSAPRRARTNTGIKDFAGGEEDELMDEVHGSRLRERARKEASSLYSVKGVISATGVSHPRTKRKRQDSQIQARSSHMDEGDDATDETDIGLSEEDDDLPPPAIPRWPGKPKLQTRQLDVENIAVDLLAVPRKARSAMVKKAPELAAQNTEVGASHLSPAPGSPRQASPSNVLSSSSNVSKKTKPSGSKSRSSKISKTVNQLSENEVEVVEALSDFARLMVNQAYSPVPEASVEVKPNRIKVEHSSPTPGTPNFPVPVIASSSAPPVEAVKSEPVMNTASSSPLQASPPIMHSSPSIVCPAQPAIPAGEVTAPKRKRPRVRPRPEDSSCNLQMRSLASSRILMQAANAGTLASRESDNHVPEAETAVVLESKTSNGIVAVHVTTTTPVTNGGHSPKECEKLSDQGQEVAVNSSTPVTLSPPKEDVAFKLGTPSKLEVSSPVSSLDPAQKTQPPDSSMENVVSGTSPPAPPPTEESGTNENNSHALNEDTNVSAETSKELESPPPSEPTSEPNPPPTVQINLMMPPMELSAVTKEEILALSSAPEISESCENGNIETVTPARIPWLEKEQQRLKESGMEKLKERVKEFQEQKPMLIEENISSLLIKKQEPEEAPNVEENVNKQPCQSKMDSTLNLPLELLKMEKTADKTASSATASTLTSVSGNASKLTLSTPSDTGTLPPALSLPGWNQGLPQIGFYGSAAAAMAAAAGAWPGVSTLASTSMSDERTALPAQLPAYLMKLPQSRKNCCTHVYIAHLIAIQQCMARSSLYANPFGSSSISHRASSHTFTSPFPPYESILGADIFPGSTLPGVSSGNAVTAGYSVRAPSERSSECAAVPSSLEPSEKERLASSIADSVPKRQLTAHQLFSAQLPSTSLQAGLPLLFPPNVATAGIGNGITGVTNATGSGANVMATGSYLSAMNRDAVIQQNNISFSFPPPQFAPLAFGGTPYLGGQQAAQYFSNPYYSMHVVHPPPQQTQSLPDVVAGLSQKPPQLQGVVNFSTMASNQHHQQTSRPQSPVKSPQGLPQDLEKDGNPESDDVSAKRIFPPHRNSHVQQSHNLSNQGSFPNPIFGQSVQVLSGHVQDYDFMTSSGKQPAKASQGKASARSQVQQQSSHSQSPKQQHQPAIVRQHGAGSPLPSSLKEIESQDSQMYGNVAYRVPPITQGLEAISMSSSIGRGSSSLQLSSKPSDVQAPKTYETGSLSKTSSGTGPLGLTPVAAVMASQGHAMFQNMVDLARNYSQQQQARDNLNGLSSSHSISHTQQQHRSLQLQRAAASNRAEEVRMLLAGNNFGDSSTGRDVLEDRSIPFKRAGISSRSDLDIISNPQAFLQNSSAVVPTHTQISCMPAPSGHATGAVLPHMNTPGAQAGGSPVNHQLKQTGVRAKPTPASGGNAAVSASSQSFPTYSDRNLAGVLSGKVQVQSSNPGQTISNTQSARQLQTFGNAQVKASQRASPGSTSPGTQALLAAAISKTQVQQPRSQPNITNVSAALRNPSSISAPAASPPTLSHQSPVTSKSGVASTGKVASIGKGSGSLPQKSSGGHSGKRNAMPTQLGTGQTVQNLPPKSSQQQHQQLSQSLQHFSSFPAPSQQQQAYTMSPQSSSNQMQQQQAVKNALQHHQQFQMKHHNYQQQQQQQQLMQSHQAILQQHSSGQQQQSDLTSHSQQQSSRHLHEYHHLLLHQQPQSSHQTSVSHLQSLPTQTGPLADSGSQAHLPGVSGAGHGTSYARIPSDGTALSQAATLRGSPHSTVKSSFSQGNSASHRSISTGFTSMPSQLGSSNGTSVGQSQAMSPVFQSVAAGLYMQASSHAASAKSSGQKSSSGSGLEALDVLQTPPLSIVKSSHNSSGAPHGHDEEQEAADSYSGKVA